MSTICYTRTCLECIFFRVRYSKAKNELLAKTSKKWAGEREIPWDGSPWLESLVVFSSQPARRSSLFCIFGPCLLPHTTDPKQTNLSQYFQVIAKLLCCELPSPIWVLNCMGPLLPARPLSSIQMCHLPPLLSNLFVSKAIHYFPISFHCRGPIQGPLKCFHQLQWDLNQAQHLCLFQASSAVSGSIFLLFFQGPFFPPLFIQQQNTLWDLLSPAWPIHAGKDIWGPARQRSWKKV